VRGFSATARCPEAIDACKEIDPEDVHIGGDHYAACIRIT